MTSTSLMNKKHLLTVYILLLTSSLLPAEEKEEFGREYPSIVQLKERILTSTDTLDSQSALTDLMYLWSDHPETIQTLKQIVRETDDDTAVQALGYLATLSENDPDFEKMLRSELSGQEHFRKLRVIQMIGKSVGNNTLAKKLLVHTVKNATVDVQVVAIKHLLNRCSDEAEIIKWVITEIKQDRDQSDQAIFFSDVLKLLATHCTESTEVYAFVKSEAETATSSLDRLLAVGTIAQYYSKYPDAYRLVSNLCLNDSDSRNRLFNCSVLARHWDGDPRLLPFLKKIALNDKDSSVRRYAKQIVDVGGVYNTKWFLSFAETIRSSASEYDRRKAVEEVAKNWPLGTTSIGLLKDRVNNDKSILVRQAALTELAKWWHDHPGVYEFVYEASAKDGFFTTVILANLAQYWKERPQTYDLILSLSESSPSSKKRMSSVYLLHRNWGSQPETIQFIQERATQDKSPMIRFELCEMLVDNAKQDSQILAFLTKVRHNDPNPKVRTELGKMLNHFFPTQ